MNKKLIFVFILTAVFALAAFSQKPKPEGQMRGEGPRHSDWTRGVDTNKDGGIDAAEFQAAIDRTFTALDKNGKGVIDAGEMPHPPKGENGPPPMGRPDGMRPGMPGQRPNGPPKDGQPRAINGNAPDDMPGQPEHQDMLPPFFFMEKLQAAGTMTKAEFERAAKEVFTAMDTNHDGVLSREESKPPRGPGGGPGNEGPPPPPNGMFIAAELRFGDKLVEGQPFSAEIVIEDTRRLYDGSTVTKSSKGATYRDAAGRTRREQTLEMVGGFDIVNQDDKPQMLVFINDFPTKTQYFLDLNNKVARKHKIDQAGPPRDEPKPPGDAKSETLGTKIIEGVNVEGTRITFEIPAGHIGNDKPIQVVTENWYSPELRLIVMSRHIDPLSGEHVFKLVNIKRSEPSADLFIVPSGFRVESGPEHAPRN